MSVLDQIAQTKRDEMKAAAARLSEATLRERALAAEPPRDFAAALRRPGLQVIAEVKRASPSAGVIRPDFDPPALAASYARGGAAALSVLTDLPHFQGTLGHLQAARAAVALPVLRKDFTLGPYHVFEARAAGADAVLLIVALLDDTALRDLLALARELRMAALVEVHDPPEVDRALAAGASLIGINNRDLRTFKTDLGTTLRMAELVEDRSVLVSESGIHSAEDVGKLADAGVRAILVGESLMRSDDIGGKIRMLMGERA